MKKRAKTKNSKKLLLVGVFVGLLLVAAGVYLYGSYQTPPTHVVEKKSPVVKDDVTAKTTALKAVSEVPTRIVIDKIDVNAAIEPVGLTESGALDAPKTNEGVGWYDKSALAGGEQFAMLLDGHYGVGEIPAVFHRLSEVALGDIIEIHGDKNSILTYKIVETEKQYIEDVDMRKALYPYRQGVQSLTIITCEGAYDTQRATYDKRSIVYAERIS